MEKRKIIHIDMDAFYASVEQRDFPQYRAKPVIVGGTPDKRGVVAACSYEARKYGIHSAMSAAKAHRLCPHAVFLRPRFEIYRKVSAELLIIFKRFTEIVEPLSLDEAYLDVTDCDVYNGSATHIAKVIKQCIRDETRLTASAGVSYNKFLAKIASDMDKPDGLYVITPDQGESFIEQLEIGKFFGIGKATEAKMNALDIYNGADLKRWSQKELQSKFGKTGNYFYNIAHGIDHRPVITSRVRKSLGTETTFEHDLTDVDEMLEHLIGLAGKVAKQMQGKNLLARTITIKVKYDNFELITRRMTLEEPFDDVAAVLPVLANLLSKTEAIRRKVRLLGVTASNFIKEDTTEAEEQLALFVKR